ncbi:uveal autoantigen with coiled-coil domains and ankyrin repeats-like isoform X2 [Stegodyphus dumicola]|nr:uveal autoantigen with coiled-coil domains and ankyrin repeats-like isoform X2 [Stegodyphus dumicola]
MENSSGPSDLDLNKEKLLVMKDEYRRLCYEARKKESLSHSTHAKMQQQIRQQWEILEELKKKKSELTLQLRLQDSESFSNKGNKNFQHFLKSLEDMVNLEEQVKKQAKALEQYKNEIADTDKKIRQKQKEIVQANRSKDRIERHRKNISFLENRLNSSLNKYNQLLIANNALREEISSLLLTQSSFRRKYAHIKHLLAVGKKTWSEVIHSATVSYQTGESVKYKLNLLKERTQIDQKKLGEKIKELKILVEQDKQLKEFMEFKAKERMTASENEEIVTGNEQILEHKLQNYHSILARIQMASGCKDVNHICKSYIEQEEANLALFEKVNEMNLEIEKLHEEVTAQRKELEIITRQYKEQQRKDLAIKSDIENVTDKLRTEAKELEDAADARAEELEYVKRVLLKIYGALDGISFSGISFSVDDSITDDNILLYLEALERRILELINCHNFMKRKVK